MSSRELVILGTASQVPTRTRNHNGYVLRWDGLTILFDPGEGTQRQLLLAGVSAASVDRICLTHLHGDHSLGLPGVLARRAVDDAPGPAVLHFPAASLRDVRVLRHAGAPAGPVPAVEVPVESDGVQARGLAGGSEWVLTAAALDHRIPAVGYRLEEPDGVTFRPERLVALGISGPDVGRLSETGEIAIGNRVVLLDEVTQPRRGQSVAVVMDTRVCAGAVEIARDVDVLLCESTYLDVDADLAAAYGHLTARQAAEIAVAAGARLLALTHFSRRYGDDVEQFAVEARRAVRAAGADLEVVAVRDLDRLALPARRA
ncbi:MBL fold metallo-hydrolase [Kineosporia sp. A_224]|uniref:MBL fold metallo-hydrolase n=1 Tax=Kineosporia sp. A_224 TaxID=1962180 RepID=UPI000B4B81A7|nr:MBL fold metallo-hydrolase [Kineosporia sp. A_224]